MRFLRRPGRLAVVLLIVGCAVLVAAIATVRNTTGRDHEPSLGPAVHVSPAPGRSAPRTATTPARSPTDDDDDDGDDDGGASRVTPGSPSHAGDDDDDDGHDDDD